MHGILNIKKCVNVVFIVRGNFIGVLNERLAVCIFSF
jgi:hypothetical protein